MKSVVMGVMMLASALVRDRGTALEDAARRLPGSEQAAEDRAWFQDAAAGGDQATASLSPGGLMPGDAAEPYAASAGDGEDEVVVPTEEASVSPEPGDWQVACLLKSGGSMIFDRGSLRALGPATLVRWAAPTDARTEGQIFTALVDCRGKTIEAAWPGHQSDTRAGTCGRRLVDAVCELLPKPTPERRSRALSPRR